MILKIDYSWLYSQILPFHCILVLWLYCYCLVIVGRVPSLVIEGKSQDGAQENGSKYILNRFLLSLSLLKLFRGGYINLKLKLTFLLMDEASILKYLNYSIIPTIVLPIMLYTGTVHRFQTMCPSLLLFTAYIKYVDTWMDKLLPMLTPLMYENGGPILMVQVRQCSLFIMNLESLTISPSCF